MSIKISSVPGNSQMLDGGSMFGNAPRAMWEKWLKPDERGRIPLACRAMLIELEGKRILCETGIGAFFEAKLADRFGVQEPETHVLLRSLEERGLTEEDIDYVVLSHLHFDHVGGLLPTFQEIKAGQERLLFPNARYIVGKEAWARALDPHYRDRASFIPGLTDKLKHSGRLIICEKEQIEGFFPEVISFRRSDGHTPGQMHIVVKGKKQTAFFAGDLVPGRPWVHLPITMGYDRFPERLIEEKQELYRIAEPNNWLVFFTHDPQVSAATLTKDDKQRYACHNQYEELDGYEI